MLATEENNPKKLEDRVLIALIVTGIAGGIVFYFIDGAKFLSAVFLSIALSAIVYKYLGGITETNFKIGLFKVTGSAAFMIGCIWFLNTQILAAGPQVDTAEIARLNGEISSLKAHNSELGRQGDSLKALLGHFKKDLGLYYAQWHNNGRRNSELAIRYLLFTMESGEVTDDEQKKMILNSLVDCSQYISDRSDFDKLLGFIGPPLNKFNQYRSTGRVYYHYADDPLGKLNLPAAKQAELWKNSFTYYLDAYNEINADFSAQDKDDIIKGIRKLNNIKRMPFLQDFISAVNDSERDEIRDYLRRI